MTSREIAELLSCRHDNVKTTIERLAGRGLVSFTATQETSHTGPGARPVQVYRVGKRDSYVIVAQLSPEFTGALVDRWQALEAQVQAARPAPLAVPTSFREALLLAAQQQEVIERQAAQVAAQIALEAPKAQVFDAVVACESA